MFDGELPQFDPGNAPDSPIDLFKSWLRQAFAAGVPEPHAMTLSTVDANGRPDARVLILKDLTPGGFAFAFSSASCKGRQLAANGAAALSLYWPLQGRQVRVRGVTRLASEEQSATDFLQRSVSARALASLGHQSTPLEARRTLLREHATAVARINGAPSTVDPNWAQCVLVPDAIEFWQADPARLHTRLLYSRVRHRWVQTQLWP